MVSLHDADACRGIDDECSVSPLPLVEAGRFSLFGPRAALRLVGGNSTVFSLVAGRDFADFEADDSDALTSLDDRDGSLLAGVALSSRAWPSP